MAALQRRHVSRTNMASRWTQRETLSDEGERMRERERTCRLNRASLSSTGADRRLRSSDAHGSRTKMAARWAQTDCETLSDEGEKTKERRTRRLSRASVSGTGRHASVASPY